MENLKNDATLKKRFSSKQNINEFVLNIENRIKTGTTYLDAILEYCEEHELEPDAAAQLLKKSTVLRKKVEVQCQELNLVHRGRKRAKLPM